MNAGSPAGTNPPSPLGVQAFLPSHDRLELAHCAPFVGGELAPRFRRIDPRAVVADSDDRVSRFVNRTGHGWPSRFLALCRFRSGTEAGAAGRLSRHRPATPNTRT